MRRFMLAVILLFSVTGVFAVSAQEEFVFGLVLVGPKNDQGWSQAHYEGALRVEESIKGSKLLLFESLNPADNPQTTLFDVATEMAGQGAKLIFTTSDEFEEDTTTVAEAMPEVVFINITGSAALEGKAPKNLGNFNGIAEMAQEIAGCAAGLMTKTNKIGYVGPLISFETRRLAASQYLGAKYCIEHYRELNGDELTFTISWIGFWFNIPGVTLDPSEEAQALFDNGYDVVAGALDTSEATVVAQKLFDEGQKVFSLGYDNRNSCNNGLDVCIGAPYYNWYPAYLKTALAVKDSTWSQAWEWIPPTYGDINNNETSIVGFAKGEALSQEASDKLDLFIAEMEAFAKNPANAGTLFLWQGPLNLQDGTPLAREGESVIPVQDLSKGPSVWYLPQLLEGMEGISFSN